MRFDPKISPYSSCPLPVPSNLACGFPFSRNWIHSFVLGPLLALLVPGQSQNQTGLPDLTKIGHSETGIARQGHRHHYLCPHNVMFIMSILISILFKVIQV